MSNETPSTRAVEWFYLEHFGFSKAPPQTDAEVVRNMALALITTASGDDELSADERRWILGYFAAKGYPSSLIDEMAALSAADISMLPELMQLGILAKSGPILIYDAIRAAQVDGYTAGERTAVRKAANLLGIDDAMVVVLEQILHDEQQLKKRRIATLIPEDHPNLSPQYHR